MKEGDLDRIVSLFRRAGVPTRGPALGPARYLELMALDKKVMAGTTRLILVKSPGFGIIDSASDQQQIVTAIKTSQAPNKN